MATARRLTATGRVRLSTSPALGRLLAAALPGFVEQHPGLSIDLILTDRDVDLVEEGVDVALRIGRTEDARLVSR